MSKLEGIHRAKTQVQSHLVSTQNSDKFEIQQSESLVSPEKRIGRPRGKRSNPSYEQVTAQLPKDLYLKLKIKLLEKGKEQDFSDLVATLLADWAKKV